MAEQMKARGPSQYPLFQNHEGSFHISTHSCSPLGRPGAQFENPVIGEPSTQSYVLPWGLLRAPIQKSDLCAFGDAAMAATIAAWSAVERIIASWSPSPLQADLAVVHRAGPKSSAITSVERTNALVPPGGTGDCGAFGGNGGKSGGKGADGGCGGECGEQTKPPK